MVMTCPCAYFITAVTLAWRRLGYVVECCLTRFDGDRFLMGTGLCKWLSNAWYGRSPGFDALFLVLVAARIACWVGGGGGIALLLVALEQILHLSLLLLGQPRG